MKYYVSIVLLCLMPLTTFSQRTCGMGYAALSRLFPNHISTTASTGFTPATDDSGRRKGTCENGECPKIYYSEKTYELMRQLKASVKEDLTKGWTLVAENKECDNGRDQDVGRWSDVSKCADRCRSKATMFTYEPNNQGYCRCQMAASTKGTCQMRDAHGKTLYKFNNNIGMEDMPVRSTRRNSRVKIATASHLPVGSHTYQGSCVKRGTMEFDGTKTLCKECNAKTVLPRDRFPRYLNEIICDSTDNYCMTYQGSCQQNYIYFNFKRDINNVGYKRRNEWITYSQPVRNGCHCQLFGGSVFDAFI